LLAGLMIISKVRSIVLSNHPGNRMRSWETNILPGVSQTARLAVRSHVVLDANNIGTQSLISAIQILIDISKLFRLRAGKVMFRSMRALTVASIWSGG
jgi:hypothetical protein